MASLTNEFFQISQRADMTLTEIDKATTLVVRTLVQAFASTEWTRILYEARWTPAGDVGADDFWIDDLFGKTTKVLPEISTSILVSEASKNHWQLTQDLGQPRWYKMIVAVERSGKFSVEFEYKDDYQEGDIMKGR